LGVFGNVWYGFLSSNASKSSPRDNGDDESMVGDNEKIMRDKKMANNERMLNDIGEKNQLTRG
jgi:hypothetical protein